MRGFPWAALAFEAAMLASLVPSALGNTQTLNLDCTDYPTVCQNDCYAAYVANKPVQLSYPGTDMAAKRRRRAAAGCGSPSPCSSGKMKKATTDANECDEYPPATVTEGGSGAILRCVPKKQNSDEGNAFNSFYASTCKRKACNFLVTFGNVGGGSTPYCLNVGGKNDGFEYQYQGKGTGKYKLYDRDSTNDTESIDSEDLEANNGTWVLHEPNPADFFPPHLRREFLLANGERAVSSSRDLTMSYDDHDWYTMVNGTIVQTYMIKELVGLEKSYELQDPALRQY